jgi:ribonuclease HIII
VVNVLQLETMIYDVKSINNCKVERVRKDLMVKTTKGGMIIVKVKGYNSLIRNHKTFMDFVII